MKFDRDDIQMCHSIYNTRNKFDGDNIQMCQLSCGVREILEVHTQLLGQLQIVLANWEEVGF